jgi:DNA-binding response OmpR family regulator
VSHSIASSLSRLPTTRASSFSGVDTTELLKQLDGVPALALIKGGSLQRQAQALDSGAEEVVNTKGALEEIVAAVERLIGQARRAVRARPRSIRAGFHGVARDGEPTR